jgi:hypothetical protein
MVWHHPAVGQVDIILELHSEHLRVDLNDNALQPIAHAFTVPIMITKYLDVIPHMIRFFPVWCRSEV